LNLRGRKRGKKELQGPKRKEGEKKLSHFTLRNPNEVRKRIFNLSYGQKRKGEVNFSWGAKAFPTSPEKRSLRNGDRR